MSMFACFSPPPVGGDDLPNMMATDGDFYFEVQVPAEQIIKNLPTKDAKPEKFVLIVSPSRSVIEYGLDEKVVKSLPYTSLVMIDRHMREDLMLITHKGVGVNQNTTSVIQHTLTQRIDRDNLVDFLDGVAHSERVGIDRGWSGLNWAVANFGYPLPRTILAGPGQKKGKWTWADRYFVLTTGRLLVFRSQPPSTGAIPLNVIYLAKGDCSAYMSSPTQLLINALSRKYDVQFATKAERDKWAAAIKSAIVQAAETRPRDDAKAAAVVAAAAPPNIPSSSPAKGENKSSSTPAKQATLTFSTKPSSSTPSVAPTPTPTAAAKKTDALVAKHAAAATPAATTTTQAQTAAVPAKTNTSPVVPAKPSIAKAAVAAVAAIATTHAPTPTPVPVPDDDDPPPPPPEEPEDPPYPDTPTPTPTPTPAVTAAPAVTTTPVVPPALPPYQPSAASSSPSQQLRGSIKQPDIGPFASWSADDVGAMLVGLGLSRHAVAFKRADVDGRLLVSLNDADLSGELGVTVAADRFKIFERIATIRANPSLADPSQSEPPPPPIGVSENDTDSDDEDGDKLSAAQKEQFKRDEEAKRQQENELRAKFEKERAEREAKEKEALDAEKERLRRREEELEAERAADRARVRAMEEELQRLKDGSKAKEEEAVKIAAATALALIAAKEQAERDAKEAKEKEAQAAKELAEKEKADSPAAIDTEIVTDEEKEKENDTSLAYDIQVVVEGEAAPLCYIDVYKQQAKTFSLTHARGRLDREHAAPLASLLAGRDYAFIYGGLPVTRDKEDGVLAPSFATGLVIRPMVAAKKEKEKRPIDIIIEGNDIPIGRLLVAEDHTLEVVRKMITDELDNVPTDYLFLRDRIPIGQRQETATKAWPVPFESKLCIRNTTVVVKAPPLSLTVQFQGEEPLGMIEIENAATVTLETLRTIIKEELDDVPDEYSFITHSPNDTVAGVPVGKKQESKKMIGDWPAGKLILKRIGAPAPAAPPMDPIPAAPAFDAPPLDSDALSSPAAVPRSSPSSSPKSTSSNASSSSSSGSGGFGSNSFLEELKKKELKKVVPVKQEPKVEQQTGLSGLLAQAMAGRRAQFGMATAPSINQPKAPSASSTAAAAAPKKPQEGLWD